MRKVLPGIVTLVLLASGLISCSKKDQPAFADDKSNIKIIGSWAPKEYVDQVTVYKKMNSLKSDEYGYIFKTDGALTIRSSASWCGTPMTYADYDGTWNLNNGTLTINGKYWGGKMVEKWEISSVSDLSFSAKRISTTFPE